MHASLCMKYVSVRHMIFIQYAFYVLQFSVYCTISIISFVYLHRLSFEVTPNVFINASLSLFCRFDHIRPEPEMETLLEVVR